MGDRNQALQEAAESLGHELHHLEYHAYFQKDFPAYRPLEHFFCDDEHSALLSGWMVAADLQNALIGGKPDMETQELRHALERPGSWWQEQKIGTYAACLEFSHLGDFAGAYTKRIQMLSRWIRSAETAPHGASRDLGWIQHFKTVHHTQNWIAMERRLEDERRNLPARLDEYRASLKYLRGLQRWLATKSGIQLRNLAMKALGDSRFTAFHLRTGQLEHRLVDQLLGTPWAAGPRTDGIEALARLRRMAREDWARHKNVPGHWHGAIITTPPLQTKEPI